MCSEVQKVTGKLEGDGKGGTPSPTAATTKIQKRTTCVASIQPHANSLHCQLEVEGEMTNFLTDTGAQISLLPWDHPAVVEGSEQLEEALIQPVTVDGNPIPLQGTLQGKVNINGDLISTKFYITTGHIPPILGLDVMRKFKHIQIDFINHIVKFGPPKHENKCNLTGNHPEISRVAQSYRVELDSNITVPSHHEVRILGNLVAPSREELLSLQGKTLIVEPSGQLGDSVACARSLVCVLEGRIPIRICNPFDADVSLHTGMFVGQAEIVPEDLPEIATLQEEDEDIALMSGGNSPGKSSREVIEDLVEGAEVSPSEKELLKEFVERHQDVFSIRGELGRYCKHPFTINTGNAHPIRQMPRPVPHHRKVEVDRQLDEMLEKGIIEPTDSEWASPILMVKKADGTLRFCVDYRKLNAVSKHDSYPLPNMNDCLSSLGRHSELYSTLDMTAGYWQVAMDAASQEKAAFTTHRGLFKPVVQPFGPKGGVAHFSRVMTALLGSLQWRILLIYLDDLLIFSSSFEEHLQRLEQVFQILKQANLKLKPSKCKLLRRSVDFLGHTISAEGISPKKDKIQAVQQWPVPRTVAELQTFLGFASFYRRYIKDFASIAYPLHQLTRKKMQFLWDAQCEEAFTSLRTALVQQPVLAHPDFTLPFILTTDASATGLGAVLSQQQDSGEKPIYYGSRGLTAAEKNYTTTERECLAIVWATEHFNYFLSGAHFIVVTDHDPLTYLHSIAEPHGRLARWILKLEQYQYTIRYKPGKDIPHADALSRKPAVASFQLPFEISWTDIAEAQRVDPLLQKVRLYYRLGKRPPGTVCREVKEFFRKRDSVLEEKEGVLVIKCKLQKLKVEQILVPASWVHRILEKGHDEAGHLGGEKTLETIRRRFFWATMFRDVKAWCKSCVTCQHRKHPHAKARAPLQYPPVPSGPGQMLAMDFVGPLPQTDKGNKHILVITDMFSKHAEAIPLPSQTAEVTAEALVKEYFCRQGLPSFLHSDQGRNFESTLITHLCKLMDIKKTRTTAYHPSGNGACERYNKTLIELISMQIERDDQTDWDSWIPLALFAYHSAPHASTGYSPFQLHMGRQPRTNLDTLAQTLIETGHVSAKTYLMDIRRRMSEVHKQAQTNLMMTMEQRKRYYDQKLQHETYTVGDLVLLKQMVCKPGCKPKLMRERWTGPWKVDRVRGPVNYRITRKNGRGKKDRILVHHDRLKPFSQRPTHLVADTSSLTSLGDAMPTEESITQEEPLVTKEHHYHDLDSETDEEDPLQQPDDSQSDSDSDEDTESNNEEDRESESDDQDAQREELGQVTPVVTRSGRTVIPNRRYCCTLHEGGK